MRKRGATPALRELLQLAGVPAAPLPELVAATQASWLRPGGERWDLGGAALDADWAAALCGLQLLPELAAYRASVDYDAVLVLGTELGDMRRRLAHAMQLLGAGLVRARRVVLLCGERACNAAELAELQRLAPGGAPPPRVFGSAAFAGGSETDAAVALARELRDGPWPVEVCGAAKRPGAPRATTVDTLLEFAPDAAGPLLLCTDQPYGLYQSAALQRRGERTSGAAQVARR